MRLLVDRLLGSNVCPEFNGVFHTVTCSEVGLRAYTLLAKQGEALSWGKLAFGLAASHHALSYTSMC